MLRKNRQTRYVNKTENKYRYIKILICTIVHVVTLFDEQFLFFFLYFSSLWCCLFMHLCSRPQFYPVSSRTSLLLFSPSAPGSRFLLPPNFFTQVPRFLSGEGKEPCLRCCCLLLFLSVVANRLLLIIAEERNINQFSHQLMVVLFGN